MVIILLAINVASCFIDFAEFTTQFGKSYEGDEAITRKALYDARIVTMETITDYTAGVNQFTDWTEEEIACTHFVIQN